MRQFFYAQNVEIGRLFSEKLDNMSVRFFYIIISVSVA